MGLAIGAEGFAGVAFEAVLGTYVAPTKYFPIADEKLEYKQSTVWRKTIRGVADVIGHVAGPSHVEGDVTFEATDDVVPYFLYAGRNTVVKTGSNPYTYINTPTHGANPTTLRSMSISVVRSGTCFGYTAMQTSKMVFSITNGVLMCTASMVGLNETTQTLPTYATTGTSTPFGSGTYTIGIPKGSPVTDTDTFTLTIDDAATAEDRLDTTTQANFVRFAERSISAQLQRDFLTRTEYDAFKTLTAQSVTLAVSKGANNSISLKLPVAIKNTYAMNLDNQGNLVRANIEYISEYDPATSKAYEFTIITPESIT